MKEILSLGAGVQSTTVLLMSCVGELPKLDAAIFADTHWEPAAVYAHLEWLEGVAGEHGIPIHRVSAGNIRSDALISQVRGKSLSVEDLQDELSTCNSADQRDQIESAIAAGGSRWASMPLYTLKTWTMADIPVLQGLIDEYESKASGRSVTVYEGAVKIPGATKGFIVVDQRLFSDMDMDGPEATKLRKILGQVQRWGEAEQRGMIKRQCTSEYKIEPIEKEIRRLLDYKPRQRIPDLSARQWFGISVDELGRMSRSRVAWKSHYYPLVEKRISRAGCIEWLQQHGFPVPPRSACLGCPFHSNDEWRSLRDTSPTEWADAVAVDRAIRNCGGLRGEVFLHRSCKPLDEADLRTDAEKGQLSLWQDECTGMCGV